MTNEVFANCPNCQHSLRVVIGRKSTAREVICDSCGKRYEYSAWKLRQPRSDGNAISLRSFYQVDLFEQRS